MAAGGSPTLLLHALDPDLSQELALELTLGAIIHTKLAETGSKPKTVLFACPGIEVPRQRTSSSWD